MSAPLAQLTTVKAVAGLAFAAALVAAVLQIGLLGEALAFDWPGSGLWVALGMQYIWLALVLATAAIAARAAIARSLPKGAMIWLILVLVADVLLIAQLWQWNLITLSL
ncbi:hypothetical protein [Parasphingorhabdus halotolerans]|uniref:Uncharacterized protein n=1 Tax=Parasphingorhabdus halotolerans TaxID=2725558 RepID=A0A6H2DIU8_9SPHN|nr:hypothetical protein [Parasphingorhabdus halotolerans]QJB68254.1 hypothetical protein HF685_02170 [Parasphingorhabdus halotolerans]